MYIGLSKTTFNSSVATLKSSRDDLVIRLTERETREKASGKWPLIGLSSISSSDNTKIAHNRDTSTVIDFENLLDEKQPFYLLMEKKGLLKFTSKNEKILNIGHHYAHALAAKFMSPFRETLILVRDGAGNKVSDLKKIVICDGEERFLKDEIKNQNEMLSLYLLKEGKLTCLDKKFQTFSTYNEISVSDGVGILYEAAAEYIFNNKRAAGKVMGLAPLGKPIDKLSVESILALFEKDKRFNGKGKEDWESSLFLEHYKVIAASIQKFFEVESFKFLEEIRTKYPTIQNIILTGGTALNCTFNMKLESSKLFKKLYIPPFPGDECISLGCLAYHYYKDNEFEPYELTSQNGYFGDPINSPNDRDILDLFSAYKLTESSDISYDAAKLLSDGNIIAWYQGRSESGPRALGNRSILSRLNKSGVKSYLNEEIKFRESFRPYGGSFIDKYARDYFEVSEDFLAPYMSFSLPVLDKARKKLSEITHDDFTSRAQILSYNQNPLFYKLIENVGELTSVYGVLNTSLNIMGEPIVETLHDLRRFFENSNVKYLCVGRYIIEK